MERLWKELTSDPRLALERGLAHTDLQSLLIEVMRTRAGHQTPARIIRRWREDRFVRPAAIDPRLLAPTVSRLWEMLPPRFVGVELSPVAPLGTCSAVATVSQNRVLSTVRGTEVVSDPTSALAVEAAAKRAGAARAQRIDLAAYQRVVRAQALDAPGLSAHFGLFVLVSSARDAGGGRTEAAMLVDHLQFWADVLAKFVPAHQPRLTVTTFDSPVLAERVNDTVRPALAHTSGVEFALDPSRTHGAGYYRGMALGLRATEGREEVDLGDGGGTDWTAAMLNDAKERCVVSCVAPERLAALTPGQHDSRT